MGGAFGLHEALRWALIESYISNETNTFEGFWDLVVSKVFGKQMLADPEKYFTDEVMTKLDEAAKIEFSYG